MMENKDVKVIVNPLDVERWTTKGTGNGGQKINKTESVVCLRHIPTGIIIKCQDGRSQKQNEEVAWQILENKLYELEKKKTEDDIVSNRNTQIGSGERSDKRRTYRDKDDLVIDHLNNKSARLKDIIRGKINLLHKV